MRRSVSVGGWLVTESVGLWGVVWPARFGAEGIEANVDDRFFLLTGRSFMLSCCLDVVMSTTRTNVRGVSCER